MKAAWGRLRCWRGRHEWYTLLYSDGPRCYRCPAVGDGAL